MTAREIHVSFARINLATARRWNAAAAVARCGRYGDAQSLCARYLASAAHHRRQAAKEGRK